MIEAHRIRPAYRSVMAESPRWDAAAGSPLWIDVYEGVLHISDPNFHEVRSVSLNEPIGCVVPTDMSGRYLCAVQSGLVLADTDGTIERILHLDRPGQRFNDGGCDPSGAFWAGTMEHGGVHAVGALYAMGRVGQPRRVLDDLTISNGIAWDITRSRMYFVDSATQRIDLFDWNADSGIPFNRRALIRLSDAEGSPDGIAIDGAGRIWVAMWGAGSVLAIDPDGTVVERCQLPTPFVTSCAFVGTDLDQLLVTTARGDWPGFTDATDDDAGGLYLLEPGVRGPQQPVANMDYLTRLRGVRI